MIKFNNASQIFKKVTGNGISCRCEEKQSFDAAIQKIASLFYAGAFVRQKLVNDLI